MTDIDTIMATLDRAERDVEILAMHENGSTLAHIASRFGLTKQRVSQICRRYGHKRDNCREHVRKERHGRWCQVDVVCHQCGAEFTRKPSTVKALNFCSQKCSQAHYRTDKGSRAYEARLAGEAWAEIAERLDCDQNTALYHAKRHAEGNGLAWPVKRKKGDKDGN